MLTEEVHALGVADAKVAGHEEAAHEKRNWVRLTYDCNNRCIFCLDSDTHDGEMRDVEEVKRQILDGRRKGATRLILSGGEPTMHPRYLDFIKIGRLAGYSKIQTVTNGRMFAYQPFLDQCMAAGLSEITFSLHGPSAKIHDALVGVKGAFEQETAGLKAALADGRPIVNVDIVINRGNVKQLPEMLRTFYGLGVREFDLLQVVPFGRAFTEGRDTLFYDLVEMQPYLREALEFSRKPDVHIWMNRFPPPHLEGFEHLIQDPYKLNDEVRGRKEEFARLLEHGVALDCRDPARCKYCYLEKLCDTLEGVRATARDASFEVIRVDAGWEETLPPVFGGDPASSRRAQQVAVGAEGAKVRLPMVSGGAREPSATPPRTPIELAEAAGAKTLWVKAADLGAARAIAAGFPPAMSLELELDDCSALATARSEIDGRPLTRVIAATPGQLEALAATSGRTYEIVALLTRDVAAWLRDRAARDALPPRLALRQPTYERLTEAAERDVIDLAALLAGLPADLPLEDLPACLTGRLPRPPRATFDAAMATPEGRLEIFRYTRRYIVDHYRTKSLRCRTCVHDGECRGVHVNWARAHGFARLQPIAAAADAAQ